ncbi:MAG: hypothetical protein B7Z40_15310 [Bosea sp. 12-68-7]|nr:MAG: hypothetical protein B7Z40_15310 [Bosea sp. 12-68-7]
MNVHTKPEIDAAYLSPVVTIKHGRVVANSRDVAQAFSKRHADVLRAIRELDCSEDFNQRNFAPFKIKDLTGESTSHVDMTRDGFVFLVMGFTGREAAKFKEAYILAFNRMEEELRSMGLIEDADDDVSVWGLPLRKVDTASRMIGVAHRVYGPDAARRLWEKDKSLPQLRRFAISRMVDTPIDDPHGCLRHLMSSEGRSQSTIGQMLDLGLRDEAAAGALRSHGILVNPGAQKGLVAIADDHPYLRGVFARTQWAGAWKQALIYLEGASRTRRQIIFSRGNSSQAVLVPSATIIKARHGGGLN